MSSEAVAASPVEEMERKARERGWPDGLLQRALDLLVPKQWLMGWLTESWATPQMVERRVDWHERLTFGPLRGREATEADNEAFIELFANSPEDVGDWEITTERGPNAFAQFRLQENVNVLVIEDRGKLVATCSFSHRKTVVGAKRVTVRYGQALRTRLEYRGQGYGDQVRSLSWGIGAARPTHGQYDIMRSQNFAVVGWWKKYDPDLFNNVPERAGEVPGVSVTVQQYPARPFAGDTSGIRKARPADLQRCFGLINRTHKGLDLFRPYSPSTFSRNGSLTASGASPSRSGAGRRSTGWRTTTFWKRRGWSSPAPVCGTGGGTCATAGDTRSAAMKRSSP